MSQPSSASSGHRRQRSRTKRPAKDSLHDLLRQNAGIPLFTHPKCWNDRHSRILGADFCKLPPCKTPLPQYIAGSRPSKGHLRPSKAIETLGSDLTFLLHNNLPPRLAAMSVRTVMSTLWPAAFGKSRLDASLPIFFGDYVYREAVPTQVMWRYPGDSVQSSQSSFRSISTRPAESNGLISGSVPAPHVPTDLPMMCYIGKEQLTAMRWNLYRIPLRSESDTNEPVFQLHQLRTKALLPANPDHDAYLVAIFLAMAQQHFYGVPVSSCNKKSPWFPRGGKPPRPAFKDLKLRILSHDIHSEEFIIYTGYITSNFLDRFHDPSRVPTSQGGDDGTLGIKIEYTKVPIWPILGLKERLGKGLGEDIVGQFDASRIETWDHEPEHPIPQDTKRKREGLLEVFNESSEEDTDVDEQGPSFKSKRRRLQEDEALSLKHTSWQGDSITQQKLQLMEGLRIFSSEISDL